MNRTMIAVVAATAGAFVLAGAGVTRKTLPQAPAQGTLVLLAPADIKWESTTRADIMRAPLWGDRSKGPYGGFGRYDGGTQLPLHFHTNELRGLILSGIWILEVRGGPSKELPPGSYFSVPGRTPHVDTCKAGAACVVYLTGDLPADLIYGAPPP